MPFVVLVLVAASGCATLGEQLLDDLAKGPPTLVPQLPAALIDEAASEVTLGWDTSELDDPSLRHTFAGFLNSRLAGPAGATKVAGRFRARGMCGLRRQLAACVIALDLDLANRRFSGVGDVSAGDGLNQPWGALMAAAFRAALSDSLKSPPNLVIEAKP